VGDEDGGGGGAASAHRKSHRSPVERCEVAEEEMSLLKEYVGAVAGVVKSSPHSKQGILWSRWVSLGYGGRDEENWVVAGVLVGPHVR